MEDSHFFSLHKNLRNITPFLLQKGRHFASKTILLNHKRDELTRRGGQDRFLWRKRRERGTFKLKRRGEDLKEKHKVRASFELIEKEEKAEKGK